MVLFRQISVKRLGRDVQQIAAEARDGTVRDNVLVHRVLGPARAATVEQPDNPIRIAFAMPEPAAEKAVAARNCKRSRARRRSERRANCRFEFRSDAFVGIEAKYPVMRGLRHCETLLWTETKPRLRDDPRAAAAGDFHGIIAAAGIDDDDFTGERCRRKAFRKLSGCIARDHTKTQGKLPGHARDDRGAVGAAQDDEARILRGFAGPLAGDCRVNAILVVRPSSLGDIVHALALVADLRAQRPELAVDWVAEESLAPLVALDPGVRRVIPLGLRRWRRHLFAAATWREMAAFRRDIRRDQYAAVLDLQEQVKGAVVALIARGPRHGPDRESIRESIATLAHDMHHAIDPNQHLIDRCRQLAAAALGYRADGPPRFGQDPDTARSRLP